MTPSPAKFFDPGRLIEQAFKACTEAGHDVWEGRSEPELLGWERRHLLCRTCAYHCHADERELTS